MHTDDIVIKCKISANLRSPQKCVACNESAEDKRFTVVAHNKLWTSKAIFKFPVCNKCYEAKQKYINIVAILSIGTIAIFLTLFTIFSKPDYLNISGTLLLLGGIVWLLILIGYMIWSWITAKRQKKSDVFIRRNNLLKSVIPVMFIPPTRKKHGEITFRFTNKSFAHDFKMLNDGHYQ